MKRIIFSVVILIVIFVFVKMMSMKKCPSIQDTNIIAPFAPKSHKNWWNRGPTSARFGYPYYSYWENFENMNDNPGAFTDKSADESTDVTDSSVDVTDESADESDNSAKKVKKEPPIMEFTPDTPSPADLHNNKPYHLLSDEMEKPRDKESLSCVNSRSCYAVDFERAHDKTGNFSQTTNNYKRSYPDSCSAPYQELTLNYYKVNRDTL